MSGNDLVALVAVDTLAKIVGVPMIANSFKSSFVAKELDPVKDRGPNLAAWFKLVGRLNYSPHGIAMKYDSRGD